MLAEVFKCGLEVIVFEHWPRYYVHFRIYTIEIARTALTSLLLFK